MPDPEVIDPTAPLPEVPTPARPNQVREILKGIGLIFLLNCAWIVFPFAYVGIGLVQLLYVLPLVHHYKKLGRTGMQQGIWIAAVITFLINATCFGILIVGSRP